MSQDIDVNAFAETLNDKLDRDLKNSAFNMDLVIAYKAPTQDDPTWYRQYKSGWIEQGGTVTGTTNSTITVTFPKTMHDTNYYVSACGCNTGRTDYADALAGFMPNTKTTTSIGLNARYWSTSTTAIIIWEVKGFAADIAEGGDDESTYGNVYKTYFYSGIYPDYGNGQTLLDTVSPTTTPITATVSENGFIRIFAGRNPNGYTLRVHINGHEVGRYPAYAAAFANEYFPVFKNDVVSLFTDSDSETWTCTLYYYPAVEPAQSTNPTVTQIVDAMYPVGSIYIGTTVNCPLASIIGTWEKIDGDLVLQSSSQAHQANTTIEAGLPNITGNVAKWNNGLNLGVSGPFYVDGSSSGTRYLAHSSDSPSQVIIKFNAARCSSVYGNSDTVQPPAYVVNIWKRTA